MKTVAELIEKRRDEELEYVKAYIRECGCDGLACTKQPCGCGIDNLFPCDNYFPDEMDACVPGKHGKNENGREGWYAIEDGEEVKPDAV